jgi:hypothetical protein
MKTFSLKVIFSAAILALISIGARSSQNSQAQTESMPPPDTNVSTTVDSGQPVSSGELPANVPPDSALAQVIRLAQAGVDPGVIMTYITNSGSTFNLDSEKIVYASDVGVPGTMVTAMMQRDQFLQQQFAENQAAQQAQQAQPTQPAPAPEAAPSNTGEVAAEPDVQPSPVSVNYFYNTLSPYGSWVVVNGYGRCWRPTVCVYNPGWQPYCDRGQWVYTDCGWYWASDYGWGATFHYGRWFRNASFGWCWYPDTVWAPSWVTWRYSNAYCGWAPLPPRTAYQEGVGIVFNGSAVSVGFNFSLDVNCFTFVPIQHFCDPHPRNFCVAPAQVTQVFNNTTVINNFNVNNRTIVNHGIAVQNIASATRTTIRPVPVHELTSPGAHGHPGFVQGANRPAFTGNSGAHAQTFATTQDHVPQTAVNQNPQPGRNWTAPQPVQPQHNNMGTTTPQRTVPPSGYYPQTHGAPVQIPPANYNQQPAPAPGQQSEPTGTPRNTTRYNESRQNHSAPEHTAPAQQAPAPSQSQPQQGGNHNGNQNWPGH